LNKWVLNVQNLELKFDVFSIVFKFFKLEWGHLSKVRLNIISFICIDTSFRKNVFSLIWVKEIGVWSPKLFQFLNTFFGKSWKSLKSEFRFDLRIELLAVLNNSYWSLCWNFGFIMKSKFRRFSNWKLNNLRHFLNDILIVFL